MTAKRWADCVIASFDVLKQCAESKQFKGLVWPDEGEFHGESWVFTGKHAGEFEPLLIDLTTARMMLTLHDALNETNQAKFKEWFGKCRGHFGALHEMTMEKVKITGFNRR